MDYNSEIFIIFTNLFLLFLLITTFLDLSFNRIFLNKINLSKRRGLIIQSTNRNNNHIITSKVNGHHINNIIMITL